MADLLCHPSETFSEVWSKFAAPGLPADLYSPAELSQAVPSTQASSRRPSSSSSPHIPLARLALADDPRTQTPVSGSRAPRSHSSYPDGRPASPAAHARPAPEPSYRPILPQTHPAQYGPPYARSTPIMPRHIDPNALATSGYPYAASQPLAPYQQGSQGGAATYDPTGLDRTTSATGRYECTWCGKGFTRPSSLKVSSCDDWQDQKLTALMAADTHEYAHRGET